LAPPSQRWKNIKKRILSEVKKGKKKKKLSEVEEEEKSAKVKCQCH